MPTKMMPPNTALWWVDQAALTTPESPKITEMTTALAKTIDSSPLARNLSPAVVAGYTLNPTDSDKQNAQSIIDTGVGETRGAANYEGLVSFFMEADPTTNTSSEYLEAYNLFKTRGRFGYWIRRVGKLYSSALVATDVVDIFLFESWTPRIVTQSGGGAIQLTVPFLAQGFVKTNVTCQA